jgi:hypothetical protein
MNIDKYELYSFIIYLYFYVIFYEFTFQQTFLKGCCINIFGNILFYKICNYNIFSLLIHKYWKEKINTIAMPQLLSCITNTLIIKNDFLIPSYITYLASYYIIKNMYPNELLESKQIRFTITAVFFIVDLFF